MDIPGFLTSKQVAALAGIKRSTIDFYVYTDKMPKPIKIGRTSVWSQQVIENWIAARPGQGARTDLQKEEGEPSE